MSIPACVACDYVIDVSDNFCRRCGASVEQTLPAVRHNMSTTIWQPVVSPVVKGAAVMAAGTVGQFIFRRVVSNLLTGNRSRGAGAIKVRRGRGDDGMVDEAQIITETVMMRRVRVRRQA